MSLLDDADLVIRPISVRAHELVYVRHLLEASEGLAFLIARRGGEALLVASHSRASELDEFIDDLKAEVGLVSRELLDGDEALDVAG